MAQEFQPVIDEVRLMDALSHVVFNAKMLNKILFGKVLGTLDTLTIFTHEAEEFSALEPIVRGYGPESRFSHGKTLYIEPEHLQIAGFAIKYLGVREPDPTRPEVGYADFAVPNLVDVWGNNQDNRFVRQVESGRGQAMLELTHPEFDIRAYLVDAAEH